MSTPRRSNAHEEQDEGDEDYENPRFRGNCREDGAYSEEIRR